MGSDFGDKVTPEEAAVILRRSRRAVSDYMKKGALPFEKEGRRTYLKRKHVEELAADLGSNMPPVNRKTFSQLFARIQKLEADLSVLKRVNGFYDSPLRPTKDESRGVYIAAERALADKYWVLEEIGHWADLFEKMDDVFFDTLAEHVGLPDPWRPFYQLCLALERKLDELSPGEKTFEIYTLHAKLQSGLSRMRRIILVWVEAGNSLPASRAQSDMDGGSTAVLRRLRAKA